MVVGVDLPQARPVGLRELLKMMSNLMRKGWGKKTHAVACLRLIVFCRWRRTCKRADSLQFSHAYQHLESHFETLRRRHRDCVSRNRQVKVGDVGLRIC